MINDFSLARFYDVNMNEIITDNLIVTDIGIPSINANPKFLGGEDGLMQYFIGHDIGAREIEISIEIISVDYLDYSLLKNILYSTFPINEPFYIVDKRVPGIRHKVVLNGSFIPERHNPINGTVVIPLMTDKPHYAESILTTLDIHDKLEVDDSLSFGMGLLTDDESHKYIHHVNRLERFRIYNAGNVPVHPFEQYLKIRISEIETSSDTFILHNSTNGSLFVAEDDLRNSDVIVLDGPNVTKNNLQYLRKTNKEFIELDPGWNDFIILGANKAKIEFDFRFYYL